MQRGSERALHQLTQYNRQAARRLDLRAFFCANPNQQTHDWGSYSLLYTRDQLNACKLCARPDMAEKNANAEEKTPAEAKPPGKKPYEKPSFRYEKVFETMALACGKVHPTQFQCRFNRKNS